MQKKIKSRVGILNPLKKQIYEVFTRKYKNKKRPQEQTGFTNKKYDFQLKIFAEAPKPGSRLHAVPGGGCGHCGALGPTDSDALSLLPGQLPRPHTDPPVRDPGSLLPSQRGGTV